MQTVQKIMQEAEVDKDLTGEKSRNAILAAYSDDFEIDEPPSLPHGGTHKGKPAWVAMQETMREHWQQKVWVDQVWEIEDEDLMINYTTMEWTANATGKTVRFPAIELIWFRDAKIARIEMFLDRKSVV